MDDTVHSQELKIKFFMLQPQRSCCYHSGYYVTTILNFLIKFVILFYQFHHA